VGDIDPDSPGLETVVKTFTHPYIKFELIRADGTRVWNENWPLLEEASYGQARDKNQLLADLDGEPGLEFLYLDYFGGIKAVHADGSTVPGWPVANGIRALAFGDVTGDGVGDVVAFRVNNFLVLNGAGEIQAGHGFHYMPVLQEVILADIDDDPELELIQLRKRDSHTAEILALNSDGTPVGSWPRTVPAEMTNDGSGRLAAGMVVADVTGDMHKEVSAVTTRLHIFSSDGVPQGDPILMITGGFFPIDPIAADVSGDGIADIVVALDHYGSGGISRTAWAWDAAEGKTVAGWPIPDLGTTQDGIIWGDPDGDGKGETVDSGTFLTLEGGFQVSFRVRCFDTNGTGVSVWTARRGNPQRTAAVMMIPGDVNHDGKINIADPMYLYRFLLRNGPPPAQFKEADFNGDGSVDMDDMTALLSYLFS
jgi:hypothetical protein